MRRKSWRHFIRQIIILFRTNLARGLLNGDPLVVLVQRHVHVDLKRTLSHSFKSINVDFKEEVQEIFYFRLFHVSRPRIFPFH
jgi:hypothetical protein